MLKRLNKNCIRKRISECATLTRCSRACKSNLYSSLTYGVNYVRSLILRIFPQHPQTNNHMLPCTRTHSSSYPKKKHVNFNSITIQFVNNPDFPDPRFWSSRKSRSNNYAKRTTQGRDAFSSKFCSFRTRNRKSRNSVCVPFCPFKFDNDTRKRLFRTTLFASYLVTPTWLVKYAFQATRPFCSTGVLFRVVAVAIRLVPC